MKNESAGWGNINLDDPNYYFTGRTEILEKVHATLHSAQTTALSQTIHGTGGVGKTQIALHYAYKHQDIYKTIMWVTSETPAILQNEYSIIADFMDLPEKDAREIKVKVAAVRNWLETHKNWLLIFDNVEVPDHVRPYLSPKYKGHVIITTRHRIWDRNVATVLRVDVFEPEESVKFLLKRTGLDEKDAAGDLAGELGHFPLALEQAGAYICENDMPIGEYLELFKEHRLTLLKEGEPVTEYKNIISTTWEVSFQKVAEKEGAIDLLNLCAYLAPDDIPLAYIKGAGEADVLNDTLNEIAKSKVAFDAAVNALAKYSLCDKEGDTLSFHRLVQEVVRNRLSNEDQEAVALIALLMMRNGFPFKEVDPATWEPSGLLMPHALAAVDRVTELGIKREEAAGLMDRVGWYLQIRADFDQSKVLSEKALALSIEINGKNHPNIIQRLNNFGDILRAMGMYEKAKGNFERALKICEKEYGKDHLRVAICANNLGEVLREMRKYKEARANCERALEIFKKTPDHPNLGAAHNNLGLVLEALGDLERAKMNLERALKIDEKAYGPEHPKIAIRLNNLGLVLKHMGKNEEAKENFETALDIGEKVFGKEHPQMAFFANNLGIVFKTMGDLEEAKSNFEMALEIFRKFLGDEHPNTLAVKKNLEMLLAEMK